VEYRLTGKRTLTIIDILLKEKEKMKKLRQLRITAYESNV
jgi:hypothetical protein